MSKMQKFWIAMLRFSQMLTLPLSFWGILLSPTRAAQVTEDAGVGWYFWLIAIVTVANMVMYYEHTWGLSALERDLGLYFALSEQRPYRPLRLKISPKLALVLMLIGVVPAVMLTFVARYERLLPVLYDWVAMPLSLANLICCVLFAILYARVEFYLKSHQHVTCWYQYRIPWYEAGVIITTYGRCWVCELERNLTEVQLANFLMTHAFVRATQPELSSRASQRVADKVLAYIDNL